ncbi:hypothetical protein E4U24_007598 [Claviceps purpurea]|nr:hypothetical protein E4U24_007598 [Claviceps purpurea]
MDPQHGNRTIKDNPIGRGFNLLHSEARRNGVCDIAAIDQLTAHGDYNDMNPAGQFISFNLFADVKILALDILICWRICAAFRVLQGIHGSVLNERDVVTVFEALAADSIEQEPLRNLLKKAIAKADDETMWDEFSTLAVTLRFEKVVIAEQSPEMVSGDRPTGSSI